MGRVAVAVAMLSSDMVVVVVVAEMALVKLNQARSEIITSLNTSGSWPNCAAITESLSSRNRSTTPPTVEPASATVTAPMVPSPSMIESALSVLRSSWTFIKELMALLKECKISEFIFGSLEKAK
jgi:hypothetical protein